MIGKIFTIKNKHGLHMRPAMMLTDMAAIFNSDIMIYTEDGSEANAESIMQVAMLAVTSGSEITIKATGEDEIEALIALEELINNDFNMSDVEN